MDDDELALAVRQLKLDSPSLSAKEVHQALLAAGELSVELSVVKKVCSKVTKALAQEPTVAAPPSDQPTLVSAPSGSVAFLRCQSCQKRLTRPRVCARCCAVAYCSTACFTADGEHGDECKSYAQHVKRDVSVSLPGAPAWLEAALRHRGDMEL